MGIPKIINEYEKNMLIKVGKDYNGMSILELGNQYLIRRDSPAKKWYQEMGADHISIDLNGRDGALTIDLQEPLPIDLKNRFDLVTNYGTLEHINNQSNALKNIHLACKPGGYIIHTLTLVDNWPGHGRYTYDFEFIDSLVEIFNYEVIDKRVIPLSKDKKEDLLVVFLRKTTDEFKITDLRGIHDSGEIEKTGDYYNKGKLRRGFERLYYHLLMKWLRKIFTSNKKTMNRDRNQNMGRKQSSENERIRNKDGS